MTTLKQFKTKYTVRYGTVRYGMVWYGTVALKQSILRQIGKERRVKRPNSDTNFFHYVFLIKSWPIDVNHILPGPAANQVSLCPTRQERAVPMSQGHELQEESQKDLERLLDGATLLFFCSIGCKLDTCMMRSATKVAL